MLIRDGVHAVRDTQLPDDTQRLWALLGNDEMKLCVDARGVMHNRKQHFFPHHPPARITWSGRRHDQRIDEYNSNLFEWGFVDMQLVGEEQLPQVTSWRQQLHPRQGYVETAIQRGEVEERTISFVHLDRNLIVFHRRYRNLPPGVKQIRATYTACQNDVDKLPFHVGWWPGKPDAHGIEIDTQADGMRMYRGRAAFFADRAAKARLEGDNRVVLETELSEEGSVTVMLALADDLTPLEARAKPAFTGWMKGGVLEIHQELEARQAATPKPNPQATIAATRRFAAQGFDAVFASQKQAWEQWFAGLRLQMPPDETELSDALDTQLYTIRSSATQWSFPCGPFNCNWGAGYHWDERFMAEGLMQAGMFELAERVAEFRRSLLPYAVQIASIRGARYLNSVTEAGTPISTRSALYHHKYYNNGIFANYVYLWCRFMDDPITWRRFYPVLRECADYYHHYVLQELPGNNMMTVPLVDVDEVHFPIFNGPYTILGAARCYRIALEVAERLGVDQDKYELWRRMADKTWRLAHRMVEMTCPPAGQRVIGDYANDPRSAISDYEMDEVPIPWIDVEPTLESWLEEQFKHLQSAALTSKDKSIADFLPTETLFWSWGATSEAYRAASNHEPERAMKALRLSLTTMMDFGALNESGRADLSEVTHPWLTTAAGGYLRALTRMLLRPNGQEIHVCPGIPADWRDFGFTFPTHRHGEVTVKIQSGRMTELTIREHKAEPQQRIVHLPLRFVDADQLNPHAKVVERGEMYMTVEVMVHQQCDLICSRGGRI